MTRENELKEQIKTWDGVNDIIAKKARRELHALQHPKEIKQEVVEPELIEPKLLTEAEAKALSKQEQVDLIATYTTEKAARYEVGRVKQILELQGGN